MNVLKDLKDSFIPHAENGYKPHFLRVKSVLSIAAFIAIVGIGTLFVQKVILENTEYLAAVIASTVVQLTNEDRAESDLGSLTVNPLLERAAQLKAEDMAKKGYFAHTSPDGTTPWYWFKAAGYNFVYAGENLAVRFYDSVDVVKAWMNSPGHRANILNSHFTEIFIGIAEGTFEGTPTVFVVQMFGSPAPDYASFPTSATKVQPATAAPQAAAIEPIPVPIASAPQGEETVASEQTSAPVAEIPIPEAAGEAPAKPEPAPEPKIIAKSDEFIAVKNETATNSPFSAQIAPDTSISLAQKLMSSPKSVAQSVYIVLSVIITLALILMIFIEFRRQHPKNVALGILLLLLMVGVLYVNELLFPSGLLVL